MNKIWAFVFILLTLITLCYMIAGIVSVNKCGNCDEWIVGKPERINENPVCDRCYSTIKDKETYDPK